MRAVQRISALAGWIALVLTGLLLIGEGTALSGGAWRGAIGDAVTWIDRADLSRWVAALLGVLIGLVALAVLVAQFVPAQLTGRSSIVDRGTTGSILVNAAAIRRGVNQRLREIPGVVAASPIAHGRRLSMRVELGRGADAASVTRAARTELGSEFWNLLGMEAIPVDIHLRYVSADVKTQQETA